jgi:tRNA dimethylallyltransferase
VGSDGRAVALVGPTAVGKSAVAVALAQLLAPTQVEILNADAMQLYRGMDIGTAKLDAAARAAVAHHLLDLWPVTHRASVVQYRDAARTVLRAVVGRGGLPVMVGGSGLYLTAALDELDVPATNPVVRARYEAMLADLGPAALHDALHRRDPQAAAGIDPANGRRLVRALEVVELTGRFRSRLPQEATPWIATRWIGLTADLAALDAAIDTRVRAMWEGGLAEEVAALLDEGLRGGPTASKAVGYREAIAFLDGELDRDDAVAATALRTRQLARRQLRWFRRDPRIDWLTVQPGQDPAPIARLVAALVDDTGSPDIEGLS